MISATRIARQAERGGDQFSEKHCRSFSTRYELLEALEEFDMRQLAAIIKGHESDTGRDIAFWCEAFEEIIKPASESGLADLRCSVIDLFTDIYISQQAGDNNLAPSELDGAFKINWSGFTDYMLERVKESDRANEGRENLRVRGVSIPRCSAAAQPRTIDECRHFGRIVGFCALPLRSNKFKIFTNMNLLISAEEHSSSVRIWASHKKTCAIDWVGEFLLPREDLRATHIATDGAEEGRSATYVAARLTDGGVALWDLSALNKNLSSDEPLRPGMWRFPCREVINMRRLDGEESSSCEGIWFSNQLDSFIAADGQSHFLRAFKVSSARKSPNQAHEEIDLSIPVKNVDHSSVIITLGVCMLGCHDGRVTDVTDLGRVSTSLEQTDTRMMASVADDATVGVWNVKTGYQVHRFTIPSFEGLRPCLRSVAYVSGVDRLVIIGSSCIVYVAQPAPPPGSGSLAHSSVQRLRGHRAPLTAVGVLAGNTFFVVTCDTWGEMRVWDLKKSECVQVIKNSHTGLERAGGAGKMTLTNIHNEGIARLLFCSTHFGHIDLSYRAAERSMSRNGLPVAAAVSLTRSILIIAEPKKLRMHSLSRAELLNEIQIDELGFPRDVDREICAMALSQDHSRILVGFTDGFLAVHLASAGPKPPQPIEAHLEAVISIGHLAIDGLVISLSEDGVCLVHSDEQMEGQFLPLLYRVEPPGELPPESRRTLHAAASLAGEPLVGCTESAQNDRVQVWSRSSSGVVTVNGRLASSSRRLAVEAMSFLPGLRALIVLTREVVEIPDPTYIDDDIYTDAAEKACVMMMPAARFRLKVYIQSTDSSSWIAVVDDRSDKNTEHCCDIPLRDLEPPLHNCKASSSLKLLVSSRHETPAAHSESAFEKILSRCDESTKELMGTISEAGYGESLKTICRANMAILRDTVRSENGTRKKTPTCNNRAKARCFSGATEGPANGRLRIEGLVVAEISGRKVVVFDFSLIGDSSLLEGAPTEDSLSPSNKLLRRRTSFTSIARSVTSSATVVSEFSLPTANMEDAFYTTTVLPSIDPELAMLVVVTHHGFDLVRLSDGAVIRRHIEPYDDLPASHASWPSAPFPFDLPAGVRLAFSILFKVDPVYLERSYYESRLALKSAHDHGPLGKMAKMEPQDLLAGRFTSKPLARANDRIGTTPVRTSDLEKLTPRTLQDGTLLDYFTWAPSLPSTSADSAVKSGKDVSHLDRIAGTIDATMEEFRMKRQKPDMSQSRAKVVRRRRAFSETNIMERPDVLARSSNLSSYEKYRCMTATEMATACSRGCLFSASGRRPDRATRAGARRLRSILNPKLASLTVSRVLAVTATDMTKDGTNVATEEDFDALYRVCLHRQSRSSSSSSRRNIPKFLPPLSK
ncbi:hypothetical protein FOL47_007716 [Perkinsus chesapeaki]|uniref:Uncharacterized protein n=1 Tax=Perkinsus chesapeaki TaxID=330153 RepID=A0A7J6LIZ1_PERCH|nr:hypothetical protein FOL47_007716 [Perkinsus chesapeaki]